MSDRSSKTEQATPRQQQRVRDEGKIALSRDLMSAGVLAASAASCWAISSRVGLSLQQSTKHIFSQLHELHITSPHVWLEEALAPFLLATAAVGGASMLASLVSGFAQTQGLFSTQLLTPNFDRLNPLPKLQQMFISKQAFTMLLQSVAKVSLIGVLSWGVLRDELEQATELWQLAGPGILTALGTAIGRLTVRVVALMAVLAAVDFVLVKRRFADEIKMTKQEVRQEHREQEGDPEIKRRQRMRAIEIGRRRMAARVAQADVVVVNPTHYAVALKYDAKSMRAPKVVAKGRNELALRMRKLARKHAVPLMHNPPLARALHAQCKLDGEVPSTLYQAVAELLAWAYRLRSHRRQVELRS